MRGVRTARLVLLAAVLAAASGCGVKTESAPRKIDLQPPSSTPTPRVSQDSCTPAPSAPGTGAASASATGTPEISAPCDIATSSSSLLPPQSSGQGTPGSGTAGASPP